MNSNYKEKYLKYKTKFLDLKTKKQLGGTIPPGFDINCYKKYVEAKELTDTWGAPTFGSWGKFKYTIGTKIYSTLDEIDLSDEEIKSNLKTNKILSDHKFENDDIDDELIKFFIYRLVDKLNYPEEKEDFGIEECKDIEKLILDDQFCTLFKSFLKKQLAAHIIPQVSNLILNAYRNTEGVLDAELETGSELRSKNFKCEQDVTDDASTAWNLLIDYAYFRTKGIQRHSTRVPRIQLVMP